MTLPQPTKPTFNVLELLAANQDVMAVIEYITKIDDTYKRSLSIDRGYGSKKWHAFGDGLRLAQVLTIEGVLLTEDLTHAQVTTQLAELAAAVNACKTLRYGFFKRPIAQGVECRSERVAAGYRITVSFIPSTDSWIDENNNERLQVG